MLQFRWIYASAAGRSGLNSSPIHLPVPRYANFSPGWGTTGRSVHEG
jgi:hypothetical protein